jgi:TonB family protein
MWGCLQNRRFVVKVKQIIIFVLVLVVGLIAAQQQDEKPRTPHVVMSEDAAAKLLLKKVGPTYPAEVKATHTAGQIVVWMVIDREGNISQAIPVARDLANRKSVNADDLRLRDAASKAVKQWKYRPYRTPGGEVAEVGTSVVLKFDFTAEPTAADAAPAAPVIAHPEPGIAGANKIHDVVPVYPQMARIAHIQGDVLVSAIINKHGEVENLRPISGHPILIQAALDAVKQWKYTPFTANGEPVEIETVVRVTFRM